MTRRFDIPHHYTALDRAFANLNARLMAPALVNFPALDLAFSRLAAVTDAATRMNSLSGLNHLGVATEAGAALNVPSVAIPTLRLESLFDFQRLAQTSLVEPYVPVPRPVDLNLAPPPPLADPNVRDELDAMWAEIDDLREQVKARPPDRKVVVKGFGHDA